MSNETRNAVILVVVIAAILFGIFMLPKGEASKYKNLDAFAACLSNQGVKMYGAYWCSHCKAQKALFGEAFKKINYVECTEKTSECQAAGVSSYPTWIIENPAPSTGTTTPQVFVGETPLEGLAAVTGCNLEK